MRPRDRNVPTAMWDVPAWPQSASPSASLRVGLALAWFVLLAAAGLAACHSSAFSSFAQTVPQHAPPPAGLRSGSHPRLPARLLPLKSASPTGGTLAAAAAAPLISPAVAAALAELQAFDAAFLKRAAAARATGEMLAILEFRRAQEIGAAALAQERSRLRVACETVAAASEAVTLGIMAPTGERAFLTLREWVRGLNLARGQVIATDLAGLQQPDPKAWWGVPVFLKYSSTGATPGDASMSSYNGPNRGVIFTPMLPDGQFRQYGDLPLYTFTDLPAQ